MICFSFSFFWRHSTFQVVLQWSLPLLLELLAVFFSLIFSFLLREALLHRDTTTKATSYAKASKTPTSYDMLQPHQPMVNTRSKTPLPPIWRSQRNPLPKQVTQPLKLKKILVLWDPVKYNEKTTSVQVDPSRVTREIK